LHSVCGFIIAHVQGIFGQVPHGDARLQIAQVLWQTGEFLEWRLHPVLWVGFAHFALFVHHFEWKVAGTMVVQIRIEVLAMKVVNRVLTLTTSRIPHESTHWSVSLMAKYAGVTTWQVRQIWQAADLKPHRLKTFKISNDPHFADKVVDIVGLYMDPPDNALVLCVDEKTQIQALDRTQSGLPLASGRIGSRTHDYKRNGTAALYAAFNVLTSEVIGRVENRFRSKEFLAFLKQVERQTPKDKALHIVLDNLSAHKTKGVSEWVASQPRIHFHFTPTSASWLNAVEGWFSQLERRALYRGVFSGVAELKAELQ